MYALKKHYADRQACDQLQQQKSQLDTKTAELAKQVRHGDADLQGLSAKLDHLQRQHAELEQQHKELTVAHRKCSSVELATPRMQKKQPQAQLLEFGSISADKSLAQLLSSAQVHFMPCTKVIAPSCQGVVSCHQCDCSDSDMQMQKTGRNVQPDARQSQRGLLISDTIALLSLCRCQASKLLLSSQSRPSELLLQHRLQPQPGKGAGLQLSSLALLRLTSPTWLTACCHQPSSRHLMRSIPWLACSQGFTCSSPFFRCSSPSFRSSYSSRRLTRSQSVK